MSNIDKDIEILKEKLEILNNPKLKKTDQLERDLQATENVLSELETNKKAVDNLLVKNAELREELETYKKMVNLLENWLVGEICKEANKKGGILNTNKVKKEIDKLARKEVENES